MASMVVATRVAPGASQPPRGRRAYAMTAPSSFMKKDGALKRGAPTIWELQESLGAHQEREEAEERVEVAERVLPASPATWGRAHARNTLGDSLAAPRLLNTFREPDPSEDSDSQSQCSHSEDGGSDSKAGSASWPRVRKQRTGVRNAMSLWEVSEALESAGPSPGHSLDSKAMDDLTDLSFIDNMFASQAPALPPMAGREDSMGVSALGVDLSKISCKGEVDAQVGPSQLAHQTPTPPPPELLPPNATGMDWDALANDSPNSADDPQMSFGGGEALAQSEPEALALLQALAEEEDRTQRHSETQLRLHQLEELGRSMQRQGHHAPQAQPQYQQPSPPPPQPPPQPQRPLDDSMQMDPGELLASLLPHADGEAAGGWHGLPSPSTLHRNLAAPGSITAGHDEAGAEAGGAPPMVPHSVQMPPASMSGGLVLPPTMATRVPDGAAFVPGANNGPVMACAAPSSVVAAPPAAGAEGGPGAVGLSIENGQLVAAPNPAGSRNGPERKEWTAAEDEIIQSGVAMFGCKWRRIAAQLPGRSDDAVRNRWNRLKEARDGPLPADGVEGDAAAPPPARRRASGGGRKAPASGSSPEGAATNGPPAADGSTPTKGAKPERMSWTKVEDATIVNGVQELGHKWYQIAQRLPGRTDHAIRNRYHRLQAMMQDQQALQIAHPMPGGPVLAMPQHGGIHGPLAALHEDHGMPTAAFPVGGFE